ncbi:MAG: hypothetical protein ABL930_10705 [Pseudobdellovibrio sp.]
MKKIALFVIAMSVLGTSAYAADCPLKNLKKNQTRSADGTAFVPRSAGSNSSGNVTSGAVYYRK